MLLGAVFIVGFAFWEAYNPHPMLDVRFFKNPRFSAASATITLTFAASFGATFLMTQYFQFLLGYSPLKAGIMITPVAVGMMTASPFAPGRVNRFGTKRVVIFGLDTRRASTGCYGLGHHHVELRGRHAHAAGHGVRLRIHHRTGDRVDHGLTAAGRAGVGSAINDTTRQTGGAIGVAVLGTIFAVRYHANIGRLLFLPAASRAAARESIGTSLATASHLSGPARLQLLRAAHTAFLDSLRLTYGVAVAVVVLAIAVAWRFLPAQAVTTHVAPYDRDPARLPDSDFLEGLEIGIENTGGT